VDQIVMIVVMGKVIIVKVAMKQKVVHLENNVLLQNIY